jgi:hypothetical protein
MKVTSLVEEIFAQAVALDQSGGLKNTIYATGTEIFILNYDHTVLLRFKLRKSEGMFDNPISFKANDYDSNHFEEKEGKIIFYSSITDKSGKPVYERKKICGTTDLTPEEVKTLFSNYVADVEDRSEVILSKEVLSLLDTDLSHIEFSGNEGETMKMIQRNIYSGGIIEVEKSQNETELFKEELEQDFGPVAMKTDDFKALFTFQDALKFYFPSRGKEDFILIKGMDENKRSIVGIIACCLYDEIIELQEVKKNGRQEQKIRRRK